MDSPLFEFSKRPFISEYEVSPEPEVLFLPCQPLTRLSGL